jgi:hypothetical protein
MKIARKFAPLIALALLPLMSTIAHADRGHFGLGGGDHVLQSTLTTDQAAALTTRLTGLGATAAQASSVVTQVNTVLADRVALVATTAGTAARTAAETKLQADARTVQTSVLKISGATTAQINTYFSAVDAEAAARKALFATTKGTAAFDTALAAYKKADAATHAAAAAFNTGALRALGHAGWDFD